VALDEPQENDVALTQEGIRFLIDKELFEEVKPITVDYKKSFWGSGFRLSSRLSAGAGGGCCG